LFSDALVSAPDVQAYFLFADKKKVAKEKATPGSAPTAMKKSACCGRPPKMGKNQIHGTRSAPDGLPGPLRGAEQRRVVGGLRLALSEPQASLASRPTSRVAQGTGAAGTDPGSPSSLLTFFLATQEESETPHKGGTQCRRKPSAQSKKTHCNQAIIQR
jgi:hypothetical protein